MKASDALETHCYLHQTHIMFTQINMNANVWNHFDLRSHTDICYISKVDVRPTSPLKSQVLKSFTAYVHITTVRQKPYTVFLTVRFSETQKKMDANPGFFQLI